MCLKTFCFYKQLLIRKKEKTLTHTEDNMCFSCNNFIVDKQLPTSTRNKQCFGTNYTLRMTTRPRMLLTFVDNVNKH